MARKTNLTDLDHEIRRKIYQKGLESDSQTLTLSIDDIKPEAYEGFSADQMKESLAVLKNTEVDIF
jgi:hypothetical protein